MASLDSTLIASLLFTHDLVYLSVCCCFVLCEPWWLNGDGEHPCPELSGIDLQEQVPGLLDSKYLHRVAC
jgi:hypothetical protein